MQNKFLQRAFLIFDVLAGLDKAVLILCMVHEPFKSNEIK